MRTSSRILALIVLMLGFLAISNGVIAQKVVRRGNTFVQQSDSTLRGGATKTQYLYTDSKGVIDTVYLSKNGHAFIYKVSKKTGKIYRRYLPEVTKQLNTNKKK